MTMQKSYRLWSLWSSSLLRPNASTGDYVRHLLELITKILRLLFPRDVIQYAYDDPLPFPCFRDFGNNSLNGPIPEFLGKLPHLKLP